MSKAPITQNGTTDWPSRSFTSCSQNDCPVKSWSDLVDAFVTAATVK